MSGISFESGDLQGREQHAAFNILDKNRAIFYIDKKLSIDIISIMDYRIKKMARNAARKRIAMIVRECSENIFFSHHALNEMDKDDLTTIDVLNVLKSNDSKILHDGELEKGSYRYRLETNFIMVVIAFHQSGKGFNIVTVWDKRK